MAPEETSVAASLPGLVEQAYDVRVDNGIGEEVLVAMRRQGRMCTEKGAQAAARVDVPTAPRQCCVFPFKKLDVGSLPIIQAQKSHSNMSGVDRRETGFFVIVWDSGLFDPALCAHLPGNDLKIDG